MNPTSPTSRRMMLKTAALAAAAVLPAASLTCAQSQSSDEASPPRPSDPWRGLKMGIASYSFRGLPLDACIKAIRRVDLHYVSIKDAHLKLNSSTEQRKEVAQKFRDAGITPISCGVIYIKNDEADARRAFEYARDIGVPTIVCSPDQDALELCDRLVKEYDIRLALHNHGPGDKHYPTPTDAWNMVSKYDPRIGLCIDVGHTARAGADPVKCIRDYKDRLYDLHWKDVTTVHGKNASVETEVGRGVLDIPGMLHALLDIHYAHHVGLEHEKDARDPVPGAAESVGYTKGVLRMFT